MENKEKKKLKKLRKSIEQKLKDLANGTFFNSVEIPNDLGKENLKKIESTAQKLGLKMELNETNQCIVYKDLFSIPVNDSIIPYFEFSKKSIEAISAAINEKLANNQTFEDRRDPMNFDVLFPAKPTVPPQSNNALQSERKKLPIFEKQKEITDAIQSNQVVVISSETGM